MAKTRRMRALRLIGAGILTWLSGTASAAKPTLLLPPSEDADAWRAAATLAGFTLSDGRSPATVELSTTGGGLSVRARDSRGGSRTVIVAVPTTSTQREDVVWLASSLLGTHTPAPAVIAAAPPLGTEPRQAIPRPSSRPASTPPPPLQVPKPSPTVGSTASERLPAARAAPPPDDVRPPPAEPLPDVPVRVAVATKVPSAPPPADGVVGSAVPDLAVPDLVVPDLTVPAAPAEVLAAPPEPAVATVQDLPRVVPTSASAGAARALGAWVAVDVGLGWRLETNPAGSLALAGGVRSGRLRGGLELGLSSDVELATVQADPVLSASGMWVGGWYTAEPSGGPSVGGLVGVSRRAFSQEGDVEQIILMPVVALDAGYALPLAAWLEISPSVRLAADLAPTEVIRGEAAPVGLSRLQVSGALRFHAHSREIP